MRMKYTIPLDNFNKLTKSQIKINEYRNKITMLKFNINYFDPADKSLEKIEIYENKIMDILIEDRNKTIDKIL